MLTYIKNQEEENEILYKFKKLVELYETELAKYPDKNFEDLITMVNDNPRFDEYDVQLKDWEDDPELSMFIIISDPRPYIQKYLEFRKYTDPDNRKIRLIFKDGEIVIKEYIIPIYKAMFSENIYNAIIYSLQTDPDEELILELNTSVYPELNTDVMDIILNFMDYHLKYSVVRLKEEIPNYPITEDPKLKQRVTDFTEKILF